MASRHSNPTKVRIDRNGNQFWARAPYNFVPLPETIVAARPPLGHDDYAGLTGWIDCDLETLSPTYVRGMLSSEKFEEIGSKKSDELTEAEKKLRADFFSTPSRRQIEGRPEPVIPGSSLRGMTRSLVEIISYSRMRWVGSTPTFTYRAVAASKDDPLSAPYKSLIGAFSRNVRAGYLRKRSNSWQVIPAKTFENEPFLKVKERYLNTRALPGYLHLSSPDYRPQIHAVSFNLGTRTGRDGRLATMVTDLGPAAAGYTYVGKLICSGNMIEGGKRGATTRRTSHTIILEADPKMKPLNLSNQVVQDYIDGITPFQREKLTDWDGNPGVLRDGAPIFYIASGQDVIAFGHNPNFRVPARQQFGNIARAATPADFLPPAPQEGEVLDLAESIFGWVDGKTPHGKQRAGRVFFGDASYVSSNRGVWYRPDPITLHPLSEPKPTTFQHYLVQDSSQGHNPDEKVSLAHYGTPVQQAQIRGNKLYWTKGSDPSIEANPSEMGEVTSDGKRQHESQLTRVVPLKPGVKFQFRVRFENLRPEELGALMWALSLPEKHCHRIGMGKPLGMGAVRLVPTLHLNDRGYHYRTLISDSQWADQELPQDADYPMLFERFVLDQVAPQTQHLAELGRIQDLLTMLEWRDGDVDWLEWTRYMEIEHGVGKVNEYKERPVLPTPAGVVAQYQRRPLPKDKAVPPSQTSTSRPNQAGSSQQPPPIKVEAPSGYSSGVVKKFGLGDNQSYGFIQQDGGGPELFVHVKNLAPGLTTLREGQRVFYKVGKNMKGNPIAIDVRLAQ